MSHGTTTQLAYTFRSFSNANADQIVVAMINLPFISEYRAQVGVRGSESSITGVHNNCFSFIAHNVEVFQCGPFKHTYLNVVALLAFACDSVISPCRRVAGIAAFV